MKKIYKVLLVFGLSASIFSCSDEFDTRTGQLNTGDLDYTDPSEMSGALVGAYNAFSTRGWEEPLLLAVRGDDVNAGGLGDQQPFADTDNFIYNNGYWMYNSLWNLHYSDIIDLNTAIVQLERYREFMEGEDERYDNFEIESSAYQFIRIGESSDDAVERGSYEHGLCLERSISF